MRILRIVLAALVVLVVSFLSLAASFGVGRGLDALRQARRMAMLRAGNNVAPAALSDRALPGDTTLDRIQVIATHNSYHVQAGPFQYFLVGLIQPGEPAKLRYTHEALYDQLTSGVRGLELDLRNRGRRLIVSHVPMVDNRSTCPDLGLALEEIRLWSRRNPDHVPITVLLELKEDYGFLDPRLKPWDTAALERLEQAIREVFPREGLLLPDDAPDATDWPALDRIRGRVMFVLHWDARISGLYHGDTLWPSGAGATGAQDIPVRIRILNDPVLDAPAIRASLERGELVRTRADADLLKDPRRREAALASGAQIISTDDPGEGGVSLEGGVLARVRP